MSDTIQPEPLANPPTYNEKTQHPMDAGEISKLEQELSQDDALLATLGYKAELKREFTALEVFGLAFSIMGLLPSIASTLVYSLPAGGPVGMVLSICHTSANL
jgi:hypothetical protein